MSSVPPALHEFRTRFGAGAGSLDPAADCAKWQQLCGELIAGRETLRQELAKALAERDACFNAWLRLENSSYQCSYTKDELLACVGQEPPLRDVIAELARDAGAPHEVHS